VDGVGARHLVLVDHVRVRRCGHLDRRSWHRLDDDGHLAVLCGGHAHGDGFAGFGVREGPSSLDLREVIGDSVSCNSAANEVFV
jgi:hypothetical protein